MKSFCDNTGLSPVALHPAANVDYTYHFGLSRFSVLDHFLLSRTLFHNAVDDMYVLHNIDNASDHDPIALRLNVLVKHIQCAERAHTPHVSWVKAVLILRIIVVLSHSICRIFSCPVKCC